MSDGMRPRFEEPIPPRPKDTDDTQEQPIINPVSKKPPKVPGPSVRSLLIAIGSTTLLSVIVMGILLAVSPMGFTFAISLFAVADIALAIVALAYLYTYNQTRYKRRMRPFQYGIQSPQYQWISDQAFERLRFLFEEGEVPILATRRHWIYLARAIWIPIVVAIGSIGASFIDIHSDYVQHLQQGTTPIVRHHHFHFAVPWWLSLTVIIIALLVACYLSIPWYSRIVIVTNKNFIDATIPPLLLPWLPAPVVPLPYNWIAGVENVDTGFGNTMGYGGFRITTSIGEFAEFANLKWWPHHNQIVRTLRDAAGAPRSIHNR